MLVTWLLCELTASIYCPYIQDDPTVTVPGEELAAFVLLLPLVLSSQSIHYWHMGLLNLNSLCFWFVSSYWQIFIFSLNVDVILYYYFDQLFLLPLMPIH